jgi:4-hydroxy-2-oxoheptanedioate aldolase
MDLKKKLRNNETVIGYWLNLGSSLTAEIIALTGFDWVLIDLEHGAGTEKDLLYQLQAVRHTSATPLVRVESFERQRIHRVLDMGAGGVMCPRINNFDEAEKAARGLRYPPAGIRGIAKMVRAAEYGRNFQNYFSGEEEITGIIQIESRGALENLDKIASLEGIDVLFIGPADLSMELGVFGQFDHPLFVDAVKKTCDTAAKYGKASGILLPDLSWFNDYHSMGMRFFGGGSDASFVVEGAGNLFEKLNGLRSENKV